MHLCTTWYCCTGMWYIRARIYVVGCLEKETNTVRGGFCLLSQSELLSLAVCTTPILKCVRRWFVCILNLSGGPFVMYSTVLSNSRLCLALYSVAVQRRQTVNTIALGLVNRIAAREEFSYHNNFFCSHKSSSLEEYKKLF